MSWMFVKYNIKDKRRLRKIVKSEFPNRKILRVKHQPVSEFDIKAFGSEVGYADILYSRNKKGRK